jgi:hypothetical protein
MDTHAKNINVVDAQVYESGSDEAPTISAGLNLLDSELMGLEQAITLLEQSLMPVRVEEPSNPRADMGKGPLMSAVAGHLYRNAATLGEFRARLHHLRGELNLGESELPF